MALKSLQQGPEWVTVQLQIRVPWWRRQELQNKADELGVTLVSLLGDAVDRVYPPNPPT